LNSPVLLDLLHVGQKMVEVEIQAEVDDQGLAPEHHHPEH
jgi:hypothetical protein